MSRLPPRATVQVKKCLYCGSTDLLQVTVRSDRNGVLKCANCQLLMVQDIPKNLDALYGADYFGKDTDTKVGYISYFAAPAANFLGKYAFARLFVGPPARHLDLGSADGSLMELFQANGFETSGLEVSPEAASVARAKGLRVTISNLKSFPPKQEKVDLVTAFDLLEHVTNPGEVTKEVYRHLNKDGFFVFSTLSVTQLTPAEFWFNNSLEHVVYFTPPSLTRMLEDVFGDGNFAFREVEINGVSEFWGIAKKGSLKDELKVFDYLKAPSIRAGDSDMAYLVSLMYNQLARFKQNRDIIKQFQDHWNPIQQVEATFYLNYFQGKFEVGTRTAAKRLPYMPAGASVFWQAFYHAQTESLLAKQKAIVQESNDEIMTLREQSFQLQGRIHRMRNYPVIGPLIKVRERLGPLYRRAIDLRVRLAKGLKWRIGRLLPAFIRNPLKKFLYYDYRSRLMKTRVVTTRKWHKDSPLVTVVVPYFNKADTIDDTIDSLRAQTFRDFELLIINDGSDKSGSVEKLAELDLSGMTVEIIHQPNRGTSATRNAGIKKAKGKYVVCLDSDDVIGPTFIEKCTVLMEGDPAAALVTTDRDDFGVQDTRTRYIDYDPQELYVNNMVITAAEFRKDAWNVSGGYKDRIGYEDWEFWINLGENGYWGKHIPEILFHYRIAMQSRFVDDKDVHWNNLKAIRELHPKYKQRVARLQSVRQYTKLAGDPANLFTNLGDPRQYLAPGNNKPNVLITIPWMTFGGAETLIYNYCRQLKDDVNLSFATGLKSDNEWDYKFQEITPRIYHMANLFEDPAMHFEFISNYIQTRKIDILHIIHNGFTFEMLPRLKGRFPELKVAVTLFNDRVAYFDQAMEVREYIDRFTSDNSAVAKHYENELGEDTRIRLIPNGINCYDEFSPRLFNRDSERTALGIEKDDLAVFFVGRISEEKNPDVFIDAARTLLKSRSGAHLQFFLVGDGPMRPKIEKQLKEAASPRIHWLGYHADVPKYLSSADIFVLPSSIEGFPLSILEAMGMRVAVVASHVGAVPDVIESGEDGFIVAPGSSDEIAEAVKKLSQDPKLLKSFKDKSREKVEQKYSTAALGRNYRNLYEELAK